MAYQIGDKPRLTTTYRDVTRALADPETLRFRFRKPDETETAYVYGIDAVVVRESVGVYHIDLSLSMSGEWWYRWEAAGTFAASVEKPLQVDDTEFETVVQS